jgi:hypothetical protein
MLAGGRRRMCRLARVEGDGKTWHIVNLRGR